MRLGEELARAGESVLAVVSAEAGAGVASSMADSTGMGPRVWAEVGRVGVAPGQVGSAIVSLPAAGHLLRWTQETAQGSCAVRVRFVHGRTGSEGFEQEE